MSRTTGLSRLAPTLVALITLAFTVVALVVFALPTLTQAQTFRRDAGLAFAGQSLSNPRGALALSTNPAGLTDLWGWESRVQLSAGGGYLGGTKGNGIGLYFASGKILGAATGVSYEGITDAVGEPSRGEDPSIGIHRVSFGGAARLSDSFRLGYALRLAISEEAETAAPMYADLGLLYRPWSWVSFGARVRGLSIASFGAGIVIDTFPQTRWGLGLAVRPFAGSDRLTASLDVDWPAGDTLGDVTFSISSRIIDGWTVMFENRTAQQNATTALPQRNDSRNLLLLSFGFGGWGGDLAFGGTNSQVSGASAALQLGVRVSGDHPGSLRDRGPAAVVVKLKGGFTEHSGGPFFANTVMQLEELATRPKTRLVVLRAEGLSLTWAQVEELRRAIGVMRSAGKKVVMYADGLGTRGYTVAVACDKIGMPDYGQLTVHGVGTGFIGLKQALSRVGVAVEAVRFGDHKSAPEQFTRTAVSPQLRRTLTRLVRHRWQRVAHAVALGRQMTVTEVYARIERGVVFPPDAKAAGFIDVVADPKSFEKQLRDWGFLTADEGLDPLSANTRRPTTWGQIPRIAMISIAGTIVGSAGPNSLGRQVGGTQIAKLVRSLKRRSEIKAIAVRIDSPGGSVSGSDIMYKALRSAAKKKPVHASMASVAASGGYWAAMGADKVYADAATVTGSIGIFALKPDLSGLWQKIGAGATLIGAGPHAGLTSFHKPWTAAERKVVRKSLRSYYDLFLSRVGKHRKIDRPRLLSLAEGRIWLGDEAQSRNLVDEIGGVSAMLGGLRAQLKLESDQPLVMEVWPRLSLRQTVMRSLGLALAPNMVSVLDDPVLRPLVRALQPWLDAVRIASVLEPGKPLAIAPVAPDTPKP
jgi:protease IV